MGGSMGAVVGEKVTRSAEHALEQRVPLIVVSASGGARMQEGTLALMQLAKTVAAIERLRAAGVPFISVLSDPTTGGVFASFAVLGDVNVAEPNALIGFAGARVSSGTIAQELPAGFQRSEFLFAHGFLDRVVHRLGAAGRDGRPARLPRAARPSPVPPRDGEGSGPAVVPAVLVPVEPRRAGHAERALAADPDERHRRRTRRHREAADRRRAVAGIRGASSDRASRPPADRTPPRRARAGAGRRARDGGAPWLTGSSSRGRGERTGRRSRAVRPTHRLDPRDAVWARVQQARNIRRPRTLELVSQLAEDFIEIHGDRLFGDDEAIVTGFARIDGRRVVVVGQQKGADTDENIRRNFGMPHPEGYRKAMRAMELAERFGMPVVTFVDVPGRPSRRGVRGARHRRGDRPLDRADEPPPDADRGGHHRRGRLRRRARDRRRATS